MQTEAEDGSRGTYVRVGVVENILLGSSTRLPHKVCFLVLLLTFRKFWVIECSDFS